ncbi:M23 family metallopeptidase [Streptomyces sp. ODS28]|uniref:M23 family metallopeptidase n=1 Tax=Streptomyces sp. ODS28 TaxID=3136688 RepID=UPI0031F0CDF1
MASNRHAPEAPPETGGAPYAQAAAYDRPRSRYDEYGSMADPYGPATTFFPAAETAEIPVAAYGSDEQPGDGGPLGEWNPTEESLRPVRGRHRVGKQRGGGMARSGAVLGVGVIAAVGAGGMATAKDRAPAPISMPDLASAAEKIPDAKELPGVGRLLADESADDSVLAGAPLSQAGITDGDAQQGRTDAGEALRARILAQAEQQQNDADSKAREAAAQQAAHAAAEKAKANAAAERKAEAEKKAKIEAEKKRKAEAERLAKLARSFTLPVSNYTLSEGFGASGGMWQSTHTGQDFASPTGTPVKAIHSGTIKEAGWAGSFGYRIVLQLDDGTELWFCHLSSMNKSAGEKVGTGDVIGRVGSTGNSSGPHLHVEVHPGGGDAIDPLAWLRGKGLSV